MSFDLDFARSQFPALATGWAFFDNAGGSQVLRPVAERVADYLLTTSVQTGASYDISQTATQRLAEARRRMATLVNANRRGRDRVRPFDDGAGAFPRDRHGQPAPAGRRDRRHRFRP